MRLVLRLLGLIAGTLLTGVLYWWLWTETGPYAWYGSVLGRLGNAGMRWAFALVVVTWIILLILIGPWLSRFLARLSRHPEARAAVDGGIAYGLAVVPFVVLLLSIYGTFGGLFSRNQAVIPPTALASRASLMPQTVQVDHTLWHLTSTASAKYPSLTSKTIEEYIPVDTKVADNPQRHPVYVRTQDALIQELVDQKKVETDPVSGMLAYEPLTARARAEFQKMGQSAPLFGVVLFHKRGALGFWVTILLVHILPFGIIGINALYSLFSKPKTAETEQPTTPSSVS